MHDEPPVHPEHVPLLHQGADDRLGNALIEALFAQADVAAYLLDRTHRVARIGPLSAVPADRPVIGRTLGELYRLDSPDDADALADEVFRSRASVRVRTRGRLAGDEGPRRSFELAAHPIGDPGDASEGVLVLAADVTERERAAARARALDAVRGRVGQCLDLATTCDDLTRAVVPDFADIAVVEIVDDVLRGAEAPLGPLGYGTLLRRTAFLGPHGGTGPAHPVGDVRSLPAPTPYTQALSDLRPRVVQIHHDTPWLAADPDRARAIHGYGAHSLLVVPLTLRGTALGLVSFYRCKESDPYEPDDMPFAVTLAAHTALSVDNARRYEREHSIASTVQRRLLPPAAESRSLVAVETAHAYLPGRNSGCWFDTVPLSGARTALSVGRVDGNGIQTAAAMGQLRTAARTLASLDLEPDELLARLADTAVTMARERAAQPQGDDPGPPLSASCLYGVYDPFTRTCTLARAGGLVPLVVGPDGTSHPVTAPEGPTLADHGEDWAPYGTATVDLEPGSLLALCTADPWYDGLGDSRPLREVLNPPDRPLRELCDAVVYESPPALDGAVILLARTGAIGADHQATWPLDHTGHAPAAARALVRRQAGEWGLTEDATDSAELVVSELVTNAVRYGTAPLTLRLLRSGSALTCEVHDGSQVAPHLRHARTVDEGGRGLFIVSQLATRWGTRYSPDGKTIWAEVVL
ncbi:SpoIIE family protein phosphatase [Streptomyces sp. NPDC005805]|uniref:ATP-binding SpoIIE family protein phosphatase n=1 Tax=Streptomyces sp. NPDC005805 TaxID=3157068 RepID=UPI00340FEBE1